MTRTARLAALFALLAGCASRADEPRDTRDGQDASPDARRLTAVSSSPAEEDAGDPWVSAPPEPPPPRCTMQPSAATCRPGGFLCDVVHGVPCCGSCIEGMCCSAREQPCSDELADTCCPGLRCGSRCVCE